MPDTKQSRYARRKIAEAADIGEIPTVVNPERREACRLNLLLFLTTYFPASTGLKPFSDDHLRVIDRIQRCILEGGRYVNAVYRGFAKTTIAENASIWATIYGHRKFVPIFGADANAASGNIESIKRELEENDLLMDDFPEACHPIRMLEGRPQRCMSQTHTIEVECKACAGKGCDECEGSGKVKMPVHTHMEWTAETIVLPTITGSVASGAILICRGITAGIRGLKFKRPDGTQQRPDFVLIDDPQTDETASTPHQVGKRMDVIKKSILKLGGHSKKIAVILNATVIQPDDLIDQLLDAKRNPSWQAERISMVRKWSDAHESMWLGEYARLRNTYDPDAPGSQKEAHLRATHYYIANRTAMDAGAVVSWQWCYQWEDGGEISALQHAYNALIDDGEAVFASEYQNQPLKKDERSGDLTLSIVMEKASGLPRGIVPLWATKLVAFIDVQDKLLFWTVMAFGEQFRGQVLDYGTWPGQSRAYFSYSDARQKLGSKYQGMEKEAAIRAGLADLSAALLGRDWHREDKVAMRITAAAIDASDGDHSDVVYEFCRLSEFKAIIRPSRGRYVGAASVPWEMFPKRNGETIGHHWIQRPLQKQRMTVLTEFDVNYWKTFVRDRYLSGKGGRGSLELFGKAEDHRLFAEHMLAEYATATEGRGRQVTEWKIRPNRPDNHWLDCVVGCHGLASISGIVLESAGMVQVVKKRKRYTSADFNRARVAV